MGLARSTQSDEYQVAQQAGREFLQAILRKDTGAAIQQFEMDSYGSTYLPEPGDSEAVLEVKRRARIRAINAIEAGMNPMQMLVQERALQASEIEAAAAQQPAQAQQPMPQQDTPVPRTPPLSDPEPPQVGDMPLPPSDQYEPGQWKRVWEAMPEEDRRLFR